MVFPQDLLDLTVELELSSVWTDVTSYVQRRDGLIQIKRGRSTEGQRVDHGMLSLALDNRDGRFSPRNPTGAYYGSIGRNTPIRVSAGLGTTYLDVPGAAGDHASAPDSAALSVTGDIDVRIEFHLDSWRGTSYDLLGKWASGQASWALYYYSTGGLTLYWSTDGSSTLNRDSTAAVPIPASGRVAVRATLDVNDGSGNHVVTFYTAPSIDGAWTQLGDPVTTAGTTSIFDSTSSLFVGKVPDFTFTGIVGRVYAAEYYNGIGGTLVANPDFTAQTAGDTSFADTASSPNTWTINGNAAISNTRYRFHGEVSSWPPRWDPTGTDVYTPIEAAGILRRLGQGSRPLQSTLYRAITTLTSNEAAAYWPCEDAAGSTSLASGSSGAPPMSVRGTPTLEGYDDFHASKAIPLLSDSYWRGVVPAYATSSGDAQVRFLLAVPAGGAVNGETILSFQTSGTAHDWAVVYGTGGTLQLLAKDDSGTTIADSGAQAFGVDGKLLRVSVELTQDGADVDWNILTLEPGASTGLSSAATLAGYTVGQVKQVNVNPGGGLDDVAVGHITVQPEITSLFDLGPQLAAYAGETAGRRVERLCDEEGITFVAYGDLDDSAEMGPQLPKSLLDLLHEAAETDDGVLSELRDRLGLGYRPRSELYNQTARVTLDYDSAELAPPVEPTDDDQLVRNDVTTSRPTGSSARVVQEDGPLSTAAPPDGVGPYETTVTANVEFDEYLPDHASWRVHVGTVDETRWPLLPVNLARSQLTGDAALTTDVLDAELGERLVVTDPPAWIPPEDITQIIQGYSEVLGNFEAEIHFNCSPESPYHVAVYGTDRYAPHTDCITNEALDTTETGVDITTPTGPLWSTSPGGNFDIMIGGERMTVTAVGAAAGTVQTLTVTRSVNGVVKSHATGVKVEFFNPPTRAL